MTYHFATPADADRIDALHTRLWPETYRGIARFLADEVEADRLNYWRQ